MKLILEEIKRLRIKKQLSQKEIAEKLGIAPQSYCRIEQGLIPLNDFRVSVLANIFEVKQEYLLNLISGNFKSEKFMKLTKDDMIEIIKAQNNIIEFLKENNVYFRVPHP